MRKIFKWFVRLIACLVFVITIFQAVISISTGYIPFSYYLNTTVDKIILLSVIIFSFIASVITLFCSFQKVKIKICVIFVLIPIILSIILICKTKTYAPSVDADGYYINYIKANSKEECFSRSSCGTKKEILDSIRDSRITKIACDQDNPCNPPLFLKNPEALSKCLGVYLEWKCIDNNCQCLLGTPLWDCLFDNCP